jgi:KaiC/GvpD/RAD55 family RecA-like ATPase
MSEPADALTALDRGNPDAAPQELARALSIELGSAETLIGAGYRSVEDVRALPDETLQALGIPESEIGRLRHAENPEPPPTIETVPPRPTIDGSVVVQRFVESVRRTERPRRKPVGAAGTDSADVLKKWVDGDDHALDDWMRMPETAVVPVPRPAPPPVAPSTTPSSPPGPETPSPAPRTDAVPAAPDTSHVLEREETVVRWLTDLLDRMKSEQFDPGSLLQEAQDLQRQLFEERERHKQLEEELEHVRRGSIAVIKFVRGREAKTREQALHEKEAEIAELRLRLMAAGLPIPSPDDAPLRIDPTATSVEGLSREMSGTPPPEPGTAEPPRVFERQLVAREQEFLEREAELRRRVVQLEGELRNLRAEAQVQEQHQELLRSSPNAISAELQERLSQAESRERDVSLRETELSSKFEEIRIRAEELERQRSLIGGREKEIAGSEEDYARRHKELVEEERRIEETRKAMGDAEETIDLSPQVQGLKADITRLQRDIETRDRMLRDKLAEIESLQAQLGQGDTGIKPSDASAISMSGKVRSGVRRLDDLFYGGLPLGAQILVNGPAHSGKEILARLFIAEGLKQGIPGILVVTDKTFGQVREEMTALLPTYATFEQKGMVRYIDLYSRSLGVTQSETGVRLLSSTDKGVLDQILAAVNSYSNEFKDKAPTYRVVFESVSTITAYLDTTQIFRFLQPFSGRRKLDNAVSYYVLETGMHTDSDLQTLEHMMDGSINLKIDQLKTFLSVRGVGEVQSRAWIGYAFNKKAFSLGSFSLDKIR